MELTTQELITAAIGWLFCPIGRVYEIMNFMTGDSLSAHQLARAFRACRGPLIEQHPWLAEINENLEGVASRTKLVEDYAKTHPGPHTIKPLMAGTWVSLDPVVELGGMVGPEKIVVVKP